MELISTMLYLSANQLRTRLDLRKAILLNSNSTVSLKLNGLSNDTAKFFMKAPDNNILEFILSSKVILVEGDAEYILMEALFNKTTNQSLNTSGIHIISVDGTSFKRYLELAKILNIRTAVIRDNDGNYQVNCIENYQQYTNNNFIRVFSDADNNKTTFEICLYQDNTQICDALFSLGRRNLTVQQYMINNKADVAFTLLERNANEINVPQYIQNAIQWINA